MSSAPVVVVLLDVVVVLFSIVVDVVVVPGIVVVVVVVGAVVDVVVVGAVVDVELVLVDDVEVLDVDVLDVDVLDVEVLVELVVVVVVLGVVTWIACSRSTFSAQMWPSTELPELPPEPMWKPACGTTMSPDHGPPGANSMPWPSGLLFDGAWLSMYVCEFGVMFANLSVTRRPQMNRRTPGTMLN